jgi:hypothetical protein
MATRKFDSHSLRLEICIDATRVLICALFVIEGYDYLNFVVWFVRITPQNSYV